MATMLASTTLVKDPNSKQPVSIYLLPSDEGERQRLTLQHNLLKRTFGWLLMPKVTESIKPGDKILDCGAGTGAWSLDLAEQLGNIGVTIQGIDIAPHIFPTPSSLKPTLPTQISFTVNSTLSLPVEWTNSFDVVHQRLLILAFDEPRWRQALSEIYRVLKPGGWVQLCEVDPRRRPSGPAYEKVLEMHEALFKKNGCLWDIPDKLAGFLQDVGFEINPDLGPMYVERRRMPIGRWAADRDGEDALNAYIEMLGALTPKFVEAGIVSSEDEFRHLLEQARDEWNTMSSEVGEKCMLGWIAIAARKPLGAM